MIRALYAASSGLVAQASKQDIIANNIANAQTAGFKRSRITTASFAQALESQIVTLQQKKSLSYPDSPVRPAIVNAEQSLDTISGPIQSTGNSLDFAIQSPGSFEVVSTDGTRLSRAGNFRMNPNGELCAADGGLVQGMAGPIRLPQGEWEVSENGAILVDGAEVDRIKIVGEKTGETRLFQGSLEGANVSIVTEMVAMIENMRSFEANQKMIQSVDHTLDKLINEAGRV